MDISGTTAPRTDQQNFDNYLAGPKTLTISEVKAGSAEQPIEIHLVEFPGQPYKPSKSMRRVLVSCWGAEASVYAGRRITLYGDPSVKFGSAVVGGLKISHLSHLDKPVSVNLTVTRGKRAPHVVQPLPDTAPSRPAPTVDPILASEWCETFNAAETVAQLQAAWEGAQKAGVTGHPDVVAAKNTRKAAL